MNAVPSTRPSPLATHEPPSPDSLAKRLFVLAMLGVFAYCGVILVLMSGGK
jgi:hypothetical protein